jgi:predicted HTH transcriptional regulator
LVQLEYSDRKAGRQMTVKIKQILTSLEGKTLEFKRDLSSPRPMLKTLMAFANTAGGRLIVGVDDDRRVVGVADPLDEEERICSLIAELRRMAEGIAFDELPMAELSADDLDLLSMKSPFNRDRKLGKRN